MGKEFTFQDLIELRSMAVGEVNDIPPRSRICGMGRPLTVEECVAVAMYRSAVSILNRKGAIKEGWIDPASPLVPLEQADNGYSLDEGGVVVRPEEKK